MVRRSFTVAEANEALGVLRPVAEEMVRRRRALVEAESRLSELGAHIAGNGAGLDPRELAALDATARNEGEALARCIARIEERGVLIKDLDAGLLDFPAQHGGDEVLLCWRVGEPKVAWWHGLDEGFAGRKPL
ncbi:MAG: DUF2203 domain-containing protein [Thermoleophilia bacterium]|nr:DUF2203 domain-containing protein [Thermoleophilia bacterium]